MRTSAPTTTTAERLRFGTTPEAAPAGTTPEAAPAGTPTQADMNELAYELRESNRLAAEANDIARTNQKIEILKLIMAKDKFGPQCDDLFNAVLATVGLTR